ncbi:MAG: GntR family transcriptional regulator [Bacillota bacterium]|nr:GntR family transcriptional regulator [Bacillota bacterium]
MKQDIENIIIDELLKDISDGKYEKDARLPSENELADSYQVPRIVVRKAYEKLEERGYIYSRQGKGRYLKGRYEQIELVLTGNESFSKKMLDKGYDLISKNVFCQKINYDEKVYNELGVLKDSEVYKVGRLRIVDRRPIALHISFVAKALFKDIEEDGSKIDSMFSYYRSKGYKEFSSEKSVLSVAYPTAEERELLKCPNFIPLLIVETNCIDKGTGKVIEYTKIIYRGDSFKYIVPR